MYKPLFNTVLVEIDDKDAKWGTGNDDAMLGASYRMGKVVAVGNLVKTSDYPIENDSLDYLRKDITDNLVGKEVIWNEGAESGLVFDDNGKQYGLVFWWDLRGVKE